MPGTSGSFETGASVPYPECFSRLEAESYNYGMIVESSAATGAAAGQFLAPDPIGMFVSFLLIEILSGNDPFAVDGRRFGTAEKVVTE